MKRLHWSVWTVLAAMFVALIFVLFRHEEKPIPNDPLKTEPLARDYSRLPDHMLVRQRMGPFRVILDKRSDANDSIWYELPVNYRIVDVSELR